MLYQGVGTLDPWIKEDRTQCSSKILLVIGTGNIGKRVAKYMKSFMRVRTYDILENDEVELIELIKSADCITLHIPKTEDNEAFFNEKKLKLMKNNSILINTARGHIVDEDALHNEVQDNKIKAAFDVFWQEPYNGKLKEYHPNKFYMSPHVASTCSGFLEGCREGLDKLIEDLNQ